MNDERTTFALSCRDAGNAPPVLDRIELDGRLDGVMLQLCLRQTYRNTGTNNLEVVYTFPLPTQAVLLGFASELNGARQEGVVVPKREAERQYEQSLEEGDAPVMLETLGDGLHTANIGNLKPDDTIVLEVRFAQLLTSEHGRLRVAIPTTIAPRYGNPGRAGLEPQQVPVASLDADYPLSVKLTIGEAFKGAAVECPTHRCTTVQAANETSLELAPNARLDRDVVVIVTPSEPFPSIIIRGEDTGDAASTVVVMAALQPRPAVPRERIALKVLVDCSGSMNGDSIASARAALRGVVAGLSANDRVSLSRFGSSVEHVLAPMDAATALKELQPIIDGIEADLGGTEMESAVDAVLSLPTRSGPGATDVLLITDGEIWDAEAMIASARGRRHRVFAIGVGSAPAEGVLRSLAEATGGACEFATPGEALEAAAQRMLRRMRQPAYAHARIEWGSTPAWVVNPASAVFAGDTVIAMAGFSNASSRREVVRLVAEDGSGSVVELARGEVESPCPGDGLARVTAARRLGDLPALEATSLAIRHQLLSKHTNCILVHRRADTDKATEEAELLRVSSMLAAGWGGLGSVAESALDYSAVSFCMPAPSRHASFDEVRLSVIDLVDETPHEPQAEEAPAVLRAVAWHVAEHLANGGQLQGLAAHCDQLKLHADLQAALDSAVGAGLDLGEAWLILAHWVNVRSGGLADAGLSAVLSPHIDAVDPAAVTKALAAFDRALCAYQSDSWVLPRAKRLRRALGMG